MFIPRHWAEASHRERLGSTRRFVTVRRFGWSSTSVADAEVHARRRVEEAVAVLVAGGPEALAAFTRRERVVAYAGADGLPIREEVLQEFPAADVVLTRNGYGAVCLNSTRAMFVDVDAEGDRALGPGCLSALVGGILAGAASVLWGKGSLGVAMGVGACLFGIAGWALARWWRRGDAHARDPLAFAVERTRAWCATRPAWLVAVYATPAGARLLPLHASFDAGDPATFAFMAHVEVDPLYERMCRLQKCFRARVSPKPWRAGVTERFRAGGTWPVTDPAKLARRAAWVARYDVAARGFASCRLVETIGTGVRDPRIEAVRRIHDERCRAGSDLPLA